MIDVMIMILPVICSVFFLIYYVAWIYRPSATKQQYQQFDQKLTKAIKFYAKQLDIEKQIIRSAQACQQQGLGLVNVEPMECNLSGTCTYRLYKNQKVVEINLNSRNIIGVWKYIENPLTTIAHEMVHAQQYFSGRLEIKDKAFYWDGKKYPNWYIKFFYWILPWEREARSKEKILYRRLRESKVLQEAECIQ